MIYIWEDDATKLSKELRLFFLLVFSAILLLAVIGNLAAIVLALQRKHRLLYKCCVISLSTSDGLMAISTCSYSISMFMHPWVNWTMGEFMCKFIPFIQTLAVLSNSFTLSSIAMDRYQGVVNAIQGRWNLTLPACIGIITSIWTIAIVSSIPMLIEYYSEPMSVIKFDENHQIAYTIADFCVVSSKHRMSIYLSLLFTLIFLPLLIAFLILYGMIGSFIWMRKPISAMTQGSEENVAITTGRGGGSRDVTTENTSAGGAATTTLTSLSTPFQHFQVQEQNTQRSTTNPCPLAYENSRTRQNERKKKRILKIIFALMLSFFVTRLPIWCFNIVSSNITLIGNEWWILQYLLSALSLLSTVLNPFLYGFLQEGISRSKPIFTFRFCPIGSASKKQSGRVRPCPHQRQAMGNKISHHPMARDGGVSGERFVAKPWSIT